MVPELIKIVLELQVKKTLQFSKYNKQLNLIYFSK